MDFHLFFFNDTATTEIYTLSLHDALPICLFVTIYGGLRLSYVERRRARPGLEAKLEEIDKHA